MFTEKEYEIIYTCCETIDPNQSRSERKQLISNIQACTRMQRDCAIAGEKRAKSEYELYRDLEDKLEELNDFQVLELLGKLRKLRQSVHFVLSEDAIMSVIPFEEKLANVGLEIQ